MSDKADLIVTGARVLTFDPGRPRAEAVAICRGRILAVGDDADVVLEGEDLADADAVNGLGVGEDHLDAFAFLPFAVGAGSRFERV